MKRVRLRRGGALARAAAEQRTSKAALIRHFGWERTKTLLPVREGPLWTMVGVDDVEPAHHDDVVCPG